MPQKMSCNRGRMSQQDPYMEKKKEENNEEMPNRDMDEDQDDEEKKVMEPDTKKNPKPNTMNQKS
jgi:hypothetical protein